MTQGLRHPSDLGRDHRQAVGERLRDDHAVRLGSRRQHQQVRGAVAAGEVGPGQRPGKAHAIGQPALNDAAAEPFRERRVAVQAARAQAPPGQVRQRRERVEQHVVALAGDHRGDAEQRPGARVPGREVGSIDSGLGDVHAVAGQFVQLKQRSPGPPAGRDDGGGGREHRALPRPGVSIRRVVAQRHVHERDQPQPARVGHQHLRGGRGDQPVEQHHGVVGDPLDDAGEGGVRRCVRSRPGAGNGVLSHRPAGLGESPADPAVIGVASARPGGIVDALGDHDVHRPHSARS